MKKIILGLTLLSSLSSFGAVESQVIEKIKQSDFAMAKNIQITSDADVEFELGVLKFDCNYHKKQDTGDIRIYNCGIDKPLVLID